MPDRRVHARYDGMAIVRYERAGKWYLEPTNPTLPRQRVKVDEAVQSALWGVQYANGVIRTGVPGGGTFDRKVLNA